MTKTYIIWPEQIHILKGEEAEKYYNAHIDQALELSEENIKTLNKYATFSK
jgi:hypothetical protein